MRRVVDTTRHAIYRYERDERGRIYSIDVYICTLCDHVKRVEPVFGHIVMTIETDAKDDLRASLNREIALAHMNACRSITERYMDENL